MKEMKTAVLLALLVMSLACQRSPKALVIGKWIDTTKGSSMTLEFFPDGETVKVARFGQLAMPGSGMSEGEIEVDAYSLPDEGHLKIVDLHGTVSLFDVIITKEKMTLTREGNLLPTPPIVLQRVR